ncbi:MAG: hypothetical protein JST22_17340 [Bacteroidetes bacterium]|nr:hypothetical protein [Bacteroidota bacterium]
MQRWIRTLLLAAAVASGCNKLITPTSPALGWDLITNGAFLPNDSLIAHAPETPNLEEAMAPPWMPATGTPQLGTWKGKDSIPGVIEMWGSANIGEGVMQVLGTPIRKGHRYRVELDAEWYPQDPMNNIRHVIVRFLAFNTVPASSGHWQEKHPDVAVIGSITTGDSTWRHFTVPVWTADADYIGFGMNAENEVQENNTPYNHSWAFCDNVELIDLGTDQ